MTRRTKEESIDIRNYLTYAPTMFFYHILTLLKYYIYKIHTIYYYSSYPKKLSESFSIRILVDLMCGTKYIYY